MKSVIRAWGGHLVVARGLAQTQPPARASVTAALWRFGPALTITGVASAGRDISCGNCRASAKIETLQRWSSFQMKSVIRAWVTHRSKKGRLHSCSHLRHLRYLLDCVALESPPRAAAREAHVGVLSLTLGVRALPRGKRCRETARRAHPPARVGAMERAIHRWRR